MGLAGLFEAISSIDLSKLPWSEGSASAIVAALLLMFFRGKLLPRSWVDSMLEVRDKSASEWHAAYLAEQETNRLQARQIDELLEIARRDAKVLELIDSTLRNSPHANT